MSRHIRPTFKPRLESLEERCVPSTSPTGLGAPAWAGIPGIIAPSNPMPGDFRVVPFKIDGGGPAPSGLPLVPGISGPHSATGNATELGHYTTEGGTFTLGSLQISPTGVVSGTFQGSIVFVAANGDKLAVNYGVGDTGILTGQLSPDGTAVTDVTFNAVFTPDPANSTGRFANVVGGGWVMIAHADSISLISPTPGFTAPFDYTWSGQGSLEYRK